MGTTSYVGVAVTALTIVGVLLYGWQRSRDRHRRQPVQVVSGWEESARSEMAEVHATYGQRLELPGRRPDVLGLAITVGLLLFLLAEALPNGLTGPQGFWIGAGGLVALVVLVLLVAVTVDNRNSRSPERDEKLEDFVFTRLADQVVGFRNDLTDDGVDSLVDLLLRWDSVPPEDRQRGMKQLLGSTEFWTPDQVARLMSEIAIATRSQRVLLSYLVGDRP
ncbi:hypothetical protein [Kribbella ginsengisoli]|uniref:DUF2207 domain-containing protein n=1 Tax=Kribbella ginsengisoli TaxID=363865 RepID=A0ABP6X071_9ACTN